MRQLQKGKVDCLLDVFVIEQINGALMRQLKKGKLDCLLNVFVIELESLERRDARLQQLRVDQQQRISSESTEEREARTD